MPQAGPGHRADASGCATGAAQPRRLGTVGVIEQHRAASASAISTVTATGGASPTTAVTWSSSRCRASRSLPRGPGDKVRSVGCSPLRGVLPGSRHVRVASRNPASRTAHRSAASEADRTVYAHHDARQPQVLVQRRTSFAESVGRASIQRVTRRVLLPEVRMPGAGYSHPLREILAAELHPLTACLARTGVAREGTLCPKCRDPPRSPYRRAWPSCVLPSRSRAASQGGVEYTDFFVGSTTVAGALAGLLFVALSGAGPRAADGGRRVHRAAGDHGRPPSPRWSMRCGSRWWRCVPATSCPAPTWSSTCSA